MTKPLTPTQAQILTAAAQHPAWVAEPPNGLPAAARNAIFQSMLRAGLLDEVLYPDSALPVLRITAAGLASIGEKLNPKEPARDAATGAQEDSEG